MIINSSNNHQMMSKDNKKSEVISSFSHLDLLEIPQTNNLNERVYFPNWYNAPPLEKSIMTFLGTHLLSKGGITTLCAKSGIGKSSIMEAFISNHLNPDCDSLGVEINLTENYNKILFIDTERSKWEVHKAWSKIMKRANLNEDFNVSEKLIYAGLKKLNALEKKQYINSVLIENRNIGLIVFDGSSDFLKNTNDNVESSEFIDWINTFDDNIALAFTIHTNPSDEKPRGHLGSELLRKCESVLIAKKQDNIFELTTEFDNGKNRHGRKESLNYKYCEDADMFISTDEKPMPKQKSNEKYNQMAIEIWGEKSTMYFAEIVEAIEKKTGKTNGASKQVFNRHFKDKLCENIAKMGWKLIGTN
jgi:hypothetical protein